MGLFSFLKKAGSKVFKNRNADEAVAEENNHLHAQELIDHLKELGLTTPDMVVYLVGDTVKVKGSVADIATREKIILALGNVEGVGSVEDEITVMGAPEKEAQFYTVVSGDNLSKISKHFYGTPNKYPIIFEANKPMLKNPDLIYPGQVLRIPEA